MGTLRMIKIVYNSSVNKHHGLKKRVLAQGNDKQYNHEDYYTKYLETGKFSQEQRKER